MQLLLSALALSSPLVALRQVPDPAQGATDPDGPHATATAAPELPDPDVAEKRAAELERALEAALIAPLRALDWEAVRAALAPEFAGSFPAPGEGTRVDDPFVEIETYIASAGATLDAEAFVAALRAQLAGWRALERAEIRIAGLPLGEVHAGGLARARLLLAGPLEASGRAELHAELAFELARSSGETPAPRLLRLELLAGYRAAAREPAFVEVADVTGFHGDLALEQRELAQLLVDERLVPLVGGLSVIDWNGDGFWDLLSTRRRQSSVLFQNDGVGGFVRERLPIRVPAESPQAFLFLDLDGDGLEELVGGAIVGYEGTRAWAEIHTRKDGGWIRVERALELELPRGVRDVQVSCIVPADVDGDGALDLFFGVYADSRSGGLDSSPFASFDGGDDLLFMNAGGLSFREESDARGISGRQYTTSALFHDFDADGDPDLFQASAAGPDWLFENVGAGRFERRARKPFTGVPGSTYGMALGDIDGDGRLALYRSGPSSPIAERLRALGGAASETLRTALASLGRGGTLERFDGAVEGALGGAGVREDARELGLTDAGFAFAPVWIDFDGDGDRELFVANGFFSHRDRSLPDWSSLHWRQVVADAVNALRRSPRVALDPELRAAFNGSFAGHERDRFFYAPGSHGGRRFDVAYSLGLDFEDDGRSAVAVDFDGDGDLDLALQSLEELHLLENRRPVRSFVRIALEGRNGTRAALGARISVRAAGREHAALVQATSGTQSQVPLEVAFGLGDASEIELVRVRWPSGSEQEWKGLPVKRRILLREADPEPLISPIARWPEESRPSPLPHARVELAARALGGGEALLGTTGRPALFCFFAPASQEDIAELARCSAAAEALGGAVRFAAISIAEPEDARALSALLDEHSVRGGHFVASEKVLAAFFGPNAPIRAPATFLFDDEGRLRRAFRRRLGAGEIEAELATCTGEPPYAYDLVRVAALHVRAEHYQEAIACLRKALRGEPRIAEAHLEIGKLFALVSDMQKAEESFARAVSIDADLASAHYNLGTARMFLHRPLEAVPCFEAALELRSDDLETLLALGTAHAEAKDFERAFAAYDRGTREHAQSPTAWYLRGKALADLGRTEEARASLEKALELAPGLTLAREALGALLK